MNYENLKLDVNNLHKLAPKLLEELETGAFQKLLLNDDTDKVTIVTTSLSGAERRQTVTIAMAKAGLNNPKMTDLIIAETKMRFEFE